MAPDDQPLVEFIREHAAAKRVVIQARQRLSGGAIQENWLLDLLIEGGPWAGVRRWVLRSATRFPRYPPALTANGSSRVLQVVHQAGVKVPRPLWLCRDMRVHGRVFFLMEYVPGVAAGRLLSTGAGTQGRARLAAQLGANLAPCIRFARRAPPLDSLPMPTRSPALATIDAYRHYLDTLADAYPVLEWGLRWYELHAPRNSILCLLHRDYRTGNYLASEQGLEAVLDWEFTGWGDPCEDLGWFTAAAGASPAQTSRPAVSANWRTSLGATTSVSAAYRAQPTALLARSWPPLRWAVIALQQGQRHLSGEDPVH
ncbi:phosphotransferase family protein [Pseudomonas aeruginosa]